MAMEDALVLAEELAAADIVDEALASYVTRRRPRVDWVHEQSRVAAQAWVLPADARNAVLRELGMIKDVAPVAPDASDTDHLMAKAGRSRLTISP